MTPADNLVWKALLETAEAGERCPTNMELVISLNLRGENTVTVALQRLEAAGHIIVIRRNNIRQITFRESGKVIVSATRRALHNAGHRKVVEVLPPRVFRDPCPRCAMRPGTGCQHGWTGEYFAQVAA